jgi:tetratricopeptide (TPR) repeat protein
MDLRQEVMAMTHRIAWLDYAIGDYESARVRFEETLAYCRDTGDKFRAGLRLRGLGMTILRLGDTRQATHLVRESLLLIQEMQANRYAALSLAAWAEVLRARGELVRAAILLSAVESEANQSENWVPTYPADYDQTLAATRAALDEEAFAAALDRGRAMTIQQAIAYALADSN